jgi:hypothetical protein
VLKVTEDIRSTLEHGQATILVLLGFSKAFDTVVHELTLCKLRNEQNYFPHSEALLGSYLGDTGGSWFDLVKKVRQWAGLFVVFLKDLCWDLNYSHHISYT